ncbi:hypothetical protein EW026_g2650 [Hermanssonia centrifuga]|uniref:U4/U6.U5 small nuclear ribonucleoprotein 27kDa protein domain-containing protein n=1 Tax=Hermanssonia centrifuga TaxID=98765 RepID=A0A4S4KS79_9APHY|nr:hypothetical protein EW026_g2650 [Hermanssonia centrifuga]
MPLGGTVGEVGQGALHEDPDMPSLRTSITDRRDYGRDDRREKDYPRDDRRRDDKDRRDNRDDRRDPRTNEQPPRRDAARDRDPVRERDPGHRPGERANDGVNRGTSRPDDRRPAGEPEGRQSVPHSAAVSDGPASRQASEIPAEEGEEGETMEVTTEDDAAMMSMMGMAGFGTTKGKHVEGNQEGSVDIKKMRTWRQYMNRRGGFNRPLDKIK